MAVYPWRKRAPRFVFNADERTFMRFAPMESVGAAQTVEPLDLSTTGLAFFIGAGYEPDEGDMIKIEFAPPGLDAIACFATVVRVDELAAWHPDVGDTLRTKVSVAFRNLPSAHERALREALDPRVGTEEQHIEINRPRARWAKRAAGLLALALAAAAMTISTEDWLRLWKLIAG